MALLVSNAKWFDDDDRVSQSLAAYLGLDPSDLLSWRMMRRSLDSRGRTPVWRAVYRVEVADEEAVRTRVRSVRPWTTRDDGRYGLDDRAPVRRTWPAELCPIIVGAGPAGLFAALYLAEAGVAVRLFERGAAVEERARAVSGFWRGRIRLDVESNAVFGEGGAGTFSDGKIYTRRRDGEVGFIFRRLVDFGADPAILQEAWAHIGTDRLRKLLPVFRERLAELGTETRYDTRIDGLLIEEGRAVGVVVAGGEEIRGSPVLVAPGHSARDTVEMMANAGAEVIPRPISIGVRIEHPQRMIDDARYARGRGEGLPPADYRLTWRPKGGGRGAHTFCMCPGGIVVPATNHVGRVVVNGMSFAGRGSPWANSAVIVPVEVGDYGSDHPLAGLHWLDHIERACFDHAGDYSAPGQRVEDFLKGVGSTCVPRTSFAMGVTPADLGTLLPDVVVQGLRGAIREFDQTIKGFGGPEGVLLAPETRTTSPVRFLRNDQGMSCSLPGLYPVGEGAGYGGGIVSCALDGLRAARGVLEGESR